MSVLLDSEPTPDPWALTAAKLRERDHDTAYADAPVLDVYARISFNPATGDLEKTDRQITDCLANIERRTAGSSGGPARLGKVLRDDNISAWKRRAKRKDWDALLKRLESRAAQGVVCWHSDRLLRQPRDLEKLIDFGEEGLVLASCFGEYDLANHDHRFQLRILTAAACKSSDDTSERQKRKAKAMREKGKLDGTGGRSFGFPGNQRTSAADRERLRQTGEKPPQVPDEQVAAERDALVWGTQKYLDGMPLADIARKWNSWEWDAADGSPRVGLRTTTGAEHATLTVRQLLARGRNANLIEHDGVTVGQVKGKDGQPEPGIVSKEQLDRVRALLATRRRGRPVTGENLLTGISQCGKCGTGLVSQPTKGTYPDGDKRRIYMCASPRGCGGIAVAQRRADEWAREMTIDVLSDPEHAEQVAKRSRAVADLDVKIAEKEATAREVGERLGRGEMSLDRYDAITRPLDRLIAELRGKRDALLALGTDASSATPDDRAAVERRWDAGTNAERRAMLRQAMPLGIVVLQATTRGRGSDVSARLQVRKS